MPRSRLLLILTSLVACGGALGTEPGEASSAATSAVTSAAPPEWFKRTGGGYVYYLQESKKTFAEIRADIHGHLGAAGYGFVLLYVPYDGDVDAYAGLGPIDYYSGGSAGGIDELRALVDEAHAQKMAVWMWANLGYSTVESPYYVKALADRRAGRSTPESQSIAWIGSSDRPKLYWEHPGFDWAGAAWQAEAGKVVDFWLDRGMSGFVLDAWGQGIGQNATNEAALEQRIYARGNTVIIRESPDFEFDFDGALVDALTGDTDASALAPMHYPTAERLVEPSIDETGDRSHYTLSPPALQVQLAVEMLNVMTPIDDFNGYLLLPAAVRAEIDHIVGAVNANRSLNLDANRRRAGTNDQRSCYVEEHTAADGGQKALAVFNFASASKTCTVTTTLASAGATRDLMTGAPGPAIAGGTLTVPLTKYGYRFLEVR